MLIEERAGQRPLALTAGVLKVLTCGVNFGVGRGPILGSGGTAWKTALDTRGVGSSTRGIVYGLVGVCSLDPEACDDETSAGPKGLAVPNRRGGDMEPDIAGDGKSKLSRSGVRESITAFQSLDESADEVGEGGKCADGVYFRTTSLQR